MTTKHNRDPGDVQRFDRWARSYEQHWLQRLFFDPVHRVVLNVADSERGGIEPEGILDIGCGTGRLLRKAGARWPAARLIGVDPAENMVDVARRLLSTATFQVGQAESLPLPDASVDLVLSTFSFHHWNDQAAGLREIARVLQPGGHFVLADPVLPAGLAKLLRYFSPNNPHFRLNTPATLRALLSQAGLQMQTQQRVRMLRFLPTFVLPVTLARKSLG